MSKHFLTCVLAAAPLSALPAGTGIGLGLYESLTSTDGSVPEKSRHCVTPAEAEKGLEMTAYSVTTHTSARRVAETCRPGDE